jgi:ParB-like chromosome segregation protein Spo0J
MILSFREVTDNRPVAKTKGLVRKILPIANIHTKEYGRREEHLNSQQVKKYREDIKSGKRMSPVHVYPHYSKLDPRYKTEGPGGWSLFDGHHRLRAHQLEGKTHIRAVIHPNPLDD